MHAVTRTDSAIPSDSVLSIRVGVFVYDLITAAFVLANYVLVSVSGRCRGSLSRYMAERDLASTKFTAEAGL